MKNPLAYFRKKNDRERVWEIDLLRGVPIIIVVLYHLCWSFMTLVYAFPNHWDMFERYPRFYDLCNWIVNAILNNSFLHTYIVPLVGGLFIFVCGISTVFSRNHLKRALLLWIAALVLTVATVILSYVMDDDMLIDFGILHLMALSLTIYGLLDLLFKKVFQEEVPLWLLALIAIIVFFISIMFWSGYCPLTDSFFAQFPIDSVDGLPHEKYVQEPLYLLLESIGYFKGTTDWWPIFPYLGVLFSGIIVGRIAYGKTKKTLFVKVKDFVGFRPFCFIGRHTLLIYLLHQPVILAILFVVFSIMGFRL